MMSNLVSVLVPVYNEQDNVEQLVNEILDAVKDEKYDFEIMLVNDGSTDSTWNIVRELSSKHPEVKGVDLAGNYGQTIALRAGLENSSGEIVVMMDGDLQHDPAYIPEFLRYLEEGYDMAGGSKANRPGNIFKKWLANFAHFIIRMLSGVRMKYFGATFRAYKRYLLDNSNMLGDAHRFLGAVVARKGVKFKEVPIEIRERNAGKSKYKLKKVFLVILDLIFLKFTVSYMNKPFRLFGFYGGIVFLLGLVFTVLLLVGSIFGDIHIREDYLAEFLFSVFLILIGLFVIAIGIIAEIGIYNYYAKHQQCPYNIREKSGEKNS